MLRDIWKAVQHRYYESVRPDCEAFSVYPFRPILRLSTDYSSEFDTNVYVPVEGVYGIYDVTPENIPSLLKEEPRLRDFSLESIFRNKDVLSAHDEPSRCTVILVETNGRLNHYVVHENHEVVREKLDAAQETLRGYDELHETWPRLPAKDARPQPVQTALTQ